MLILFFCMCAGLMGLILIVTSFLPDTTTTTVSSTTVETVTRNQQDEYYLQQAPRHHHYLEAKLSKAMEDDLVETVPQIIPFHTLSNVPANNVETQSGGSVLENCPDLKRIGE